MRTKLAAGLVSLLCVLVFAGQVGGQAPSIQVTFLDCDTNPEVVFVENVGGGSQDLTGWTLRSDPVGDPSQRFDLSVVGSLAPGGRARIFSGGGPPSSDPAAGRFLWEANAKYRDGDPSDFAEVVDADGAVVARLNCGNQPAPSTPAQPPEPDCDPSYPGVCIPVGADDYDCEGGQGDGPNYIEGPLQVLPPDPHGLDPDGDGVGCAAPPTSEVAGVAQAPDAPAAGFGPPVSEAGGALSWLVAGLTGAGIAWLIAGAAVIGVAAFGSHKRHRPHWMAVLLGGRAATSAGVVAPDRPGDTPETHGAGSGTWFVAARSKLASGPIISVPPFKADRGRRP